MIQKLYDKYICPHLIDFIMSRTPFPKQRKKIIPNAEGRVLEIGIGSGLNLELYDPNKVSDIFSVDPDNVLIDKARKRANLNNISLHIESLSAEELPFESNSFDTVVSTYTLCSINNVDQALAEVNRVMKEGSKFIFSEHGKSPDENVFKWQKRLNPIWSRIAGGCHLDKDIPLIISNSNFNIPEIQSTYVPGPRFGSYHYWGYAVANK